MQQIELPHLPTGYFWRVENSFQNITLDKDQVRVALYKYGRWLGIPRKQVLAEKVFHYKSAEKREKKTQRAATKMWRHEADAISMANAVVYGAYMAREDMLHNRYNTRA